ncbi:O-antigen ligase family protein [Candidatus Collierbacteria bacterium]|nr:O-antigen ligase family protein [Candidatus Collierbacteria bacterium]
MHLTLISSAIIFAFFDQTSIRFNLVYFLIATGILGLVFVRKLKNTNFQIPKEIKVFWMLLVAQSFISSIFTTNSVPISAIGLSIALSALVYFSFGAVIKDSNRKFISVILLVSSIIFPLISLGMIFKIIPFPDNQANLFAWTFGHNRLAGLLILLLPASMVFASGLEGWKRILVLLSLSLPFLTLIFSAGRAAILGFLIGLVYLGKYGPIELKKWLKLVVMASLIPILILTGFPMIDRLVPNSGLMKAINSDPLIHGILVKPLSNDGRMDYWRQAGRAILDLPLGWGTENSFLVLPRFRQDGEQISAYVHNQYLQAGVEMGVVGALIYILLIVLVLRQAHQTVKADTSGWPAGIFAGILASAAAAFFDYDWQYPSIYLLWWFLAGTLMVSGQQISEANQKNHWPKVVAVLSLVVLIYGTYSAATKLALNGVRQNWNYWGKSVFPFVSPPSYVLHPDLGQQALAIGLANLPFKQIPGYIKQNRRFFRFDNRMMEKVLRWQEAFGNKNDATATALQMLENDPRDTYAKTVLEKFDKKE